MAAAVIVSDGCGLRIEIHRRNQPSKNIWALLLNLFYMLDNLLKRRLTSFLTAQF